MNAPHLDDERLSAYLDGSPFDDTDPGAADHLASCGSCRARLEAFRSVAELVGAPVAPPGGAVDAAVAAALAAEASPGGSPVVPISTAVRRRRTQVGLAAAAAVVTVVLGVTSLRGGGDNPQDMAARGASGTSAAGPDLGDQSDPTALADRVRTVVEGEFAAGSMSPTADSAEGGAAGATGGGSAGQAEGAPAEGESDAMVTSKGALAARSLSIRPTGPCTATARSEYGRGLADLVFEGTLRWEGTPAVVLAYRIEGATGALDHRVLVLARDDCRLLVAQTI